jgi:hypothetical protein
MNAKLVCQTLRVTLMNDLRCLCQIPWPWHYNLWQKWTLYSMMIAKGSFGFAGLGRNETQSGGLKWAVFNLGPHRNDRNGPRSDSPLLILAQNQSPPHEVRIGIPPSCWRRDSPRHHTRREDAAGLASREAKTRPREVQAWRRDSSPKACAATMTAPTPPKDCTATTTAPSPW